MFCSKCGTQLPDEAVACPNCGEKVEKDINFSDVTNYAGQKVQQVSTGLQSQVQNFQQAQRENAESRKIKDVRELFVNETEQQKAVIGGGYLSNMLSSGILEKGFGVLTDRRLYYRGSCFYKMGGHYRKTDEDCIIDLQDITSSCFTYTRHIWILRLLAVSVLWLLFLFIMAETSSYSSDAQSAITWLILSLIFITLPLLMAYLFYKQSVYEVTFAGGSLSIKASAYGVSQVRAFDKALHLAKDELVSH